MSSSSSMADVKKEWGKGWNKIVEAQQALAKKRPALIHLRGPHDAIISRTIPLALSAVGIGLSLRGVFNMILGREGDMITSKVIPLALTAVSTVLLVPGLFRMYLGLHD
ncbi:hypothetical protein CHLNCDRAFT_143789 [Chlorella variabilis]|uniref:Uncharacterized protein n=1 Tax=Chlorella variabilis TaxID=554065 RepID=E1ZAF9_CHLVA|nr:hypothetical protein CHLNCDRAFT_143789 [Chlorella variabilis]EFN57054.1 hypothetical protein CHLNCDRAFT_143789 [Chlorella variabilis]|eukprot:XP_005849156.1 hypothetical protein CHLNCDRAFT_143789 [Chlorella variabilis]